MKMENELKQLRLSTGLPAKELVTVVKTLYPKYDKTMQSKAENTQDYGVILAPDAMRLLRKPFGVSNSPKTEKSPEQKKRGHHRFTCRISCRLPDRDYERLQHRMYADGYTTIQNFLTTLVKEYLEKDDGSQ